MRNKSVRRDEKGRTDDGWRRIKLSPLRITDNLVVCLSCLYKEKEINKMKEILIRLVLLLGESNKCGWATSVCKNKTFFSKHKKILISEVGWLHLKDLDSFQKRNPCSRIYNDWPLKYIMRKKDRKEI